MQTKACPESVAVIGAGLAGSECAWVLAEKYGLAVTLFEMKSIKQTPAQVFPHLFAELVCSNSLKSKSRLNPAGLLKKEIASLGSLVVPVALDNEVPAGETLAVDREKFSSLITQKIKSHKNIKVVSMVVEKVQQVFSYASFSAVVVATGPLTDDALSRDLIKVTNLKESEGHSNISGCTSQSSNEGLGHLNQFLYFYDAIAPIIDGDSIDYSVVFKANRQTRTQSYEARMASLANPRDAIEKPHENIEKPGQDSENSQNSLEEGDYLNIPFNKEEYFEFVKKVREGDKVPHHDFEEPRYFNGCQPIEVLAERGEKTLAFGPMKPKGLIDPRTGRMPYAVIQLRKENLGDTAWNMVGFQTRLTWTAQKQIFRTLPGLQNAEFFRMGSMHRNTYLISPRILNDDFSFKSDSRLFLAGQIMGVEGYLESAAMGVFIAHMIGYKLTKQQKFPLPPMNTALGTLVNYCIHAEEKHFTPMNTHWGLFLDLSPEDIEKYKDDSMKINVNKKLDKSVKRDLMARRSENLFSQWLNTVLA